LRLKILTYFVTSLAMPDPQSSDMCHTVSDVSAPSGISSSYQAVN